MAFLHAELLGRAGRIVGGQNSCKFRCAARRAPQALLQVWRLKFECGRQVDLARYFPYDGGVFLPDLPRDEQ